jgi:hypothetical protein
VYDTGTTTTRPLPLATTETAVTTAGAGAAGSRRDASRAPGMFLSPIFLSFFNNVFYKLDLILFSPTSHGRVDDIFFLLATCTQPYLTGGRKWHADFLVPVFFLFFLLLY